jgi:hypothetical protein
LASAPTSDVKIRLAERDQRQAADSRTEIERYLNDPPPDRHALAQRKSHIENDDVRFTPKSGHVQCS